MNREAYFRRAHLLHTQCYRSLKGVVSNPAHLHKRHMKATCKCHPERTDNRLKRDNMASFTLRGRGNKVEAFSSSWQGGLVLLLQLFGSSFITSCWSGSRWDAILLSQPWEFSMGFLVGWGTQGQLYLGSILSPLADSYTRG